MINSILGFFSGRANTRELRESKDERLIGEIVRAMARRGWPTTQIQADSDRQRVRFRAVGDPVLHNAYVTLDRRTGGSAIGDAVLGSKATLTLTGEIKNRLSDPDDLVRLVRTDMANLLKVPAFGEIRVNHELNSVFATTTLLIDINGYVDDPKALRELDDLMGETFAKLAWKLRELKRS